MQLFFAILQLKHTNNTKVLNNELKKLSLNQILQYT
jgi:hypothetical protein